MEIEFLLNGVVQRVEPPSPVATLLDWLRETRGMTGTKEGCNEGDCGACTVMVTDGDGARALNACILFLPQLHGKAVRTVEGVAGPGGEAHPAQKAMVEHHGSQCGFCTPGFVVSMAVAHLNGAQDHDDQLAGNLCRCTGYAPIIRAAGAAAAAKPPEWMTEDLSALNPRPIAATETLAVPESADDLARWHADHPDATLIAGATDVGVLVNKALRDFPAVAFLNRCADLREIVIDRNDVRIGAAATIREVRAALAPLSPSFGELLRRFGAEQVRGAATLGGNIANGSPVGDGPPALIAAGAILHLRLRDDRREIPLEDFFIEYGVRDLRPGEFVEAATLPRGRLADLRCYKVSKRFDQDISSVCGCFAVRIDGGVVAEARLAYGGMAGTPKRAAAAEAALAGRAWSEDAVGDAMTALEEDFAPIDDLRASAGYRMKVARNLLKRYFLEMSGERASVMEVQA